MKHYIFTFLTNPFRFIAKYGCIFLAVIHATPFIAQRTLSEDLWYRTNQQLLRPEVKPGEWLIGFESAIDLEMAMATINDEGVFELIQPGDVHKPFRALKVRFKTGASALEIELLRTRWLSKPSVMYVRDVLTLDGEEMLVGNIIMAAPNAISNNGPSKAYLSSHGYVYDILRFGSLEMYLVRLGRESEIFHTIHEIEASQLFEYVEPDIIGTGQIDLIPNDQYFSNQWFLNQSNDKDIDAPEAWDITTGVAGVRVAVIDGNGYDLSHTELSGKLISPYDAVNNNSNPTPENEHANHGTPCAGLVGARTNNSTGVAGVGYNVTVVPVNIGYNAASGGGFSTSASIMAAACSHVSGVAGVVAVSNSYTLGSWAHNNSTVRNAFANMRTQSRNGLGAVVLASTGNDSNGSVSPAPAGYPLVIGIGSSDQSDTRASYSNYGDSLEVMAPGVSTYTLDRSGSAGYESGSYTNFNGTSAACPVAAGVVGLMASANTSLTGGQLAAYLQQCCEKVGGYNYTNTAGRPHGTWNNQMGYGRINARTAVQLATGGSSGGCSGTVTLTTCSGNISDGSGSSNYNNNLDCRWLIQPSGASAVTLNFQTFDTELNYDFVIVYNGANINAPVLGTFSGTNIPSSITGGGVILVRFISDGSISRAGWALTYNCSSGCSGITNLTSCTGNFTDGSGSNNYSDYQDCAWRIQPPGAGSITLSFSAFATESCCDAVYIYDGADVNAPLIASFAGTSIPPNVTSSGGVMYVRFVTDYSVTYSGWAASYTCSSGCSGTVNLSSCSGTISDGSGSGEYSNYQNCAWLIQPPGASSITLSFTSFLTEGGYDYVRVYDGNSINAPLLGSYSGSTLPASVSSSTGVMYVTFTTDGSVTAAGWSANYSCATCQSPSSFTILQTGHAYFRLGWDGVAGASGYQTRNRPVSASTWEEGAIFSTTGVYWGNREPCTNYEVQVRTLCGNTWSAWSSSLTTTTLGCNSPVCISYGLTWDDWVANVQVSNLNNATGKNYGYADFTNLSANVNRNQSYPITLTPATDDNAETVYWRVWADWNKDNDFNDTGEKIIELTGSNTSSVVGNFTVPNSALLGNTRMRVSMSLSSYSNPCDIENYREVEDYTLVVASGVLPPIPLFTANITSGSAPLSVNFTDQSANNPTSWFWQFGNGQTSTQQHPSVTYSNPGLYSVKLRVSNAAGTDSLTRTSYIQVEVPVIAPVANFTSIPFPAVITAGQAVSFFDQSSNNPTSWNWNFGNGQTSTAQNPANIVYANPGAYTVSLTVNNTAGGDAEVKTGYVVVEPPVLPPVANFNATPTSGTAPLAVFFTDLSTNNPDNWFWDFGNGQTSAMGNPGVIVFQNPGEYDVSLFVSNSSGANQIIKTAYIRVDPPAVAPVANFTSNTTCGTAPLSVQFTDVSSNTPTAWNWSFSNGESSTLQSPNITFDDPGVYSVTLTTSNAGGADVEVKNGLIVVTGDVDVTALPDWSVCLGTSVLMQASSNVPNGNTLFKWSGSNLSNTIGSSVTAQPQIPGTFNYTIIASTNGCDAPPVTVQLQVTSPPVVAIFAENMNTCVGNSVMLIAYGAEDYIWAGIGLSNTAGDTTFFTPTFPGEYTIQVIGATNGCAGAPKTVNIQVSSGPLITVNASALSICLGETVQLSASGASTYQWSGNGISGNTGASITVTPTVAGNAVVTVVGSIGSCSSSPVPVNINVLPAPDMTITSSQPSPICLGETISLQANGATLYTWTGDGLLNNTGPSVMISPQNTGTQVYTVTGYSNGCEAQESISFDVQGQVLSVEIDYTGCPGQTIQFTSVISGGGSSPNVIWYRNGAAVWSGATFPMLNALEGEQVYCQVIPTNPLPCTHPAVATSAVVTVFCVSVNEPLQDLSLKVIPNPNQGVFQLAIDSEESISTQLRIWDATGRMVYDNRLEVVAGARQYPVDIATLEAGLYHLSLSAAGETKSLRFVLMR